MNKKLLLISGVAALALAAIAITVSSTQDAKEKTTVKIGKEYLFPGLLDNLNNVGKIHLEDGSTSLTMVKASDSWGLANKDNYPVQVSRIREDLIKLGNMTLDTEKTSNPEWYSRLQVEDVEQGATGKQIELFDESGKSMASVILGKTEYIGSDQYQYIRKPGEKASWQVKGMLMPNMNSNGWLEKEVLAIEKKRPEKVTIEHHDGSQEVVKASRIDSAMKFELDTLPEGRELKSASVTSEFETIMNRLNFDDVKKRDGFPFPKTPKTTTTMETFDGLVVTANTYEIGPKTWFTFEAKADENAIKEENALRQKEADEANKAAEEAAAAEAAANESEETENEETLAPEILAPQPIEPDLIDEKEIIKEAEELNSTIGQWVYTFPSYVTQRFSRDNEHFLKEVVEEEPEEAEETDALSSLPNLEGMTPPATNDSPLIPKMEPDK